MATGPAQTLGQIMLTVEKLLMAPTAQEAIKYGHRLQGNLGLVGSPQFPVYRGDPKNSDPTDLLVYRSEIRTFLIEYPSIFSERLRYWKIGFPDAPVAPAYQPEGSEWAGLTEEEIKAKIGEKMHLALKDPQK